MLDELSVTNLGLIASATIEPGPGLVVITGETGTGKTLLLGALRLLRGETAAKDLIGPAGDQVVVEGRFVIGGEELVLGRRVAAGRSRAYRDGSMVPARALEESADGLLEIVAQNDHLAFTDRGRIRDLLDGTLDGDGAAALAAYREAWARLADLQERRRLLGGDRRALERELEMARFQASEIEAAGFGPGDDAELETRAVRLRNAEALGEHLAAAAAALGEDGAQASIDAAARALALAARTDASLGDVHGQLREVASLLGEVVADVAAQAGDMERDPDALQHVEARLALLGDLCRKYGDDLAGVLAFGARAAARAAEIEGLLDQTDAIDADVATASAGVGAAAEPLREARRRAADRVASDAVVHLVEMGFDAPVLRFDVAPAEPAVHGADVVTLVFASDEELTPGPVSRIASGGELSRVVLALRLATGASDAPVVAFDEIDAGVGGSTALAVGRKLASLAKGRQVLCVTHLPQVAAFAGTHLVVRRRGSEVAVAAVDGTDRLEEMTRMLSGLPESDQGRAHAGELLEVAGRWKGGAGSRP